MKEIINATVQDLLDAGVVSKDWVEVRRGRIRGQLNFRRCEEVLERHRPWWYLGQRPATDYEDRNLRIDMWVNHCYTGWMPIQVKSSMFRMRQHVEKERINPGLRKIPIVVSNEHMSDQEIVAAFERAALFERQKGDFRKKYRRLKNYRR